MADNYQTSFAKADASMEIIKPVIEPWVKGTIYTVNTNCKDNINRLLDTTAGIDVIIEDYNNKYIYGMACRIQYDIDYHTFTIRVERKSGATTELEKRIIAIKNKAILPIYTMQAYVDIQEKRILSLGIINTLTLYNLYALYPILFELRKTRSDQKGQACFFSINFEKIKSVVSADYFKLWDGNNINIKYKHLYNN